MTRSSRINFAVSMLALTLAFANPAVAEVDANKVSTAIVEMMAGYGIKLQTTGSELQGANVVLKGLSVATPEGTAEPFGDVTLNNVSETADGYLIGDISAPAKSYPVTDGTWEFGGASIKNITLPATGTTDPAKKLIVYELAEIGPSRFKAADGAEFINFAGAKATMSKADGSVLSFDLSVPDISINTSVIPNNDPQFAEVVSALGLTNLQLQISAKGSWNMADGRLTLTEQVFGIKNAGKINFTADILGYTPQLMDSMSADIKASAGQTDAEKGAKMMGLLQQVSVSGMSLRFDDESLVGKALDLIAKRTGQPKEALLAQAKGMAPMFLMQLQDPEFSTAATTALSTFLDNPKNLEIKFAPAAPVSVSQLVASGMAAPATLIKQLGLTVIANQ